MRQRLINWLVDHQSKLAIGLGAVSVAVIFLATGYFIQAGIVATISVALIYFGSLICVEDTSSNWSRFSYGGLARGIVGGAMMLIGWIALIRGVVAVAIAVALVRAS